MVATPYGWPIESVCVCVNVCVRVCARGVEGYSGSGDAHGVASDSRLLKIAGLFCRISSLLLCSFAKETYDLRCLRIEATPFPQPL